MEILIKNPKLPKRAGKAILHFRDDISEPFREKGEIHLPILPFHGQDDESGVFLLKSGVQFLWRRRSHYDPGVVYFGGTDEEAFLVRLHPDVWRFFQGGGEEVFFQALKPSSIKIIERISKRKTRRQGDIFAAKFESLSWKVVLALNFLHEKGKGEEGPRTSPVEYDKITVFETRHLFTGVGLQASLPLLGEAVFVEGLLQAPDHADVELKGIHVLRQAAYLFDPKKAE